MIESWKRRKLMPLKNSNVRPIIDEIAEHIENNPEAISKEDFIAHLLTLFAAVSFTLFEPADMLYF